MEGNRVVSNISLFDGNTHPAVVATVKFDNFPSPVVVMDRFCTNLNCDCRDTNLIFYETVNKVLGDELFEIKINVDSWETVSYQAMRRNADCENMYREFISDIDETTRLKIKKRFEEGKKFGGDFLKETIDFDGRQVETLCYAEIFNSPYYDRFLIEHNGTNYVVLELYDCFMEGLDDPGFEFLKNRYARMKNLGTALGLERTPTTNGHHAISDNMQSGKVGRNEPCPCGSGRPSAQRVFWRVGI